MIRTRSAEILRRALFDFANASAISEAELVDLIRVWPGADVRRLLSDWLVWARDDQLPPRATTTGESWRTWVFLGGRGAGKTRAGAEWVRGQVAAASGQRDGALRIALVGQTIADVRQVMVEGDSGLLSVHADGERPDYEPSKNRLSWPSGARAFFFSAERPDGLRGPQFHAAWCDELVKWRYPAATWDMLQFALRLGSVPQAAVTTTPKPMDLLKQLLADRATVVSRATTFANRTNLAPAFLADVERRYRGTALGRQELEGEIIEDMSGALWRRDWIETARCDVAPEGGRRVVAVDPPVTAHAASDACGIIVATLGPDRRGYVLADRTLQGRSPDVWAGAVNAAFRDYEADRVVVEVNQGGDLVEQVLRQSAPALPIRKVRATRGKWLRAEPVAALYAEGRVSHVGTFKALEQQMLTFGAGGGVASRSPDRLDALVWAMTDLMLRPESRPALRRI